MEWDVLVPDDVAARLHYQTGGDIELEAGKSFVIETSPNGEEFVNLTVPASKKWSLIVSVTITEEDA